MKTILALLLSCLALSAATTYPMLSDVASRTASGGGSNTSQAIHFAGKAHRDSGEATITVSSGSELQLNPIGTFSWGLALDGDTSTGAVRARVTGEAGKPISWALTLNLTEITQ